MRLLSRAKDIARIPIARSAPCRFWPHLTRGCGVLDSAKSARTSRSTLGLDSPRADVTHYSTRRCSRLSVLVAGITFTHQHTHSRPGIHTHRAFIHTHARLRHPPVQSQNSRHHRSDARTRAHCPHQVVLCNFSLDSSSLFLPPLLPSFSSIAFVPFLRQVGFIFCLFVTTARFAGT